MTNASLATFAVDSTLTLVFAALLYCLPGVALLAWLLPPGERPWEDWLGLSAGVSLPLYPVLMLIAHLLNIKLGTPVIIGIVLLSGAATVWRLRAWNRPKFSLRLGADFWPGVLLASAWLIVATLRLYVVRGVPAALWGDGYQHTLITQLLVDNGGLFSSWEPYAPLTTFTYHFGFHAAAAVYHWLSSVEVVRATLVAGQLVNALASLALVPLANRVARTRWAGPVVVIITGLLSSMPLYYVNWGRYTQLAGQVILPVAVWLTLELGEREKRHLGLNLLMILVMAGLALTHYRVVLFFLLFVALWLVWVALRFRHDWPRLRAVWLRIGLTGLAALLLTWPWIQVTLGGNLPEILRALLMVRPSSDFIRGDYNAIGSLTFFAPYWLAALAVLGAVWGGVRRQASLLLIAIWIGLLFGLSNPDRLGLPGTGIVNNFAVLIALYLPLGILAAYVIGGAAAWLASRYSFSSYALAAGGLALAVVGARARLSVVDPAFMLVTPEDMAAMAWIRANVPTDVTFLVNSFPAYGNSSVVGSDAGWWLPLLAGRKTTLPPLPYVSEKAFVSDYRTRVNEFHATVWKTALDSAEGAAWLRANHVTHIYIGQKEGMVGNGTGIALSAQLLESSPFYQLIYRADDLRVFEILP
jgi:hypothetical protein